MIWNNREREFNDPPVFYDWFVCNCKEVVRSTMLKPARMCAGLGNPPQPFYTNDVESHNNVIKKHTDYTAHELPQFVEKMKSFIINQREEIERAVIGMGEYRVSKEFDHLAVDARKYVHMSDKQKTNAISRFFNAPYEKRHLSDAAEVYSERLLNTSHENPLHLLPIPQYIADKIWRESEELASSGSDICASPGSTDGSAWLVKSTVPTHQRPFFVECKKTGQVSCEKSCVLFNSCGMCTHTVAVAKKKGCMDALVKWLNKRDDLNVTKLANSGLPKGAGKKGRSKRKFSTKSSTKNVKKMLQNISDDVFTPQIGISTKSAAKPGLVQTTLPPETTSVVTSTSRATFTNPPYLPCLPPPLTSPPLQETPPPLFHDLQSCIDAAYGSSSSASPQSLVSTNLCAPPPLIRAPVQVSMPVMYAPMYYSQSAEMQECEETPFYLVFVKGNISKCGGCGKKDLRDLSGKPHPPPEDLCLQHKEFIMFDNPHTGLRQRSHDQRNVYYHARKACAEKNCCHPKVIIATEIRVRLSTIHMHHIMQEFGLEILNNMS